MDRVPLRETEESKEEDEVTCEKKEKEIEDICSLIDDCKSDKRSINDVLQSLRQYLNIEGSDWLYFIGKNEKEKILTSLENDLKRYNDPTDHLALEPTDVIKRSTALNGTFFTKNPDDWKKVRCKVINIEGETTFTSIEACEVIETFEFYTEKESTLFDGYLETFGLDSAINACMGFFDRPLERMYLSDQSNNTGNTQTYITYVNRSTYSVLPVVLWESSTYEFCLTENVIKCLHNIEQHLPMKDIVDRTKSCFTEFGSHVYIGNVQFGGTFKVETKYIDTDRVEKHLIRHEVGEQHTLANKAVNNFAASIVLPKKKPDQTFDEINSDPTGKKKNNRNIESKLFNYGGPANVSSFHLWKKGLIQNERTWVVVKGGKPYLHAGKLEIRDYISLWDLVLKESNKFKMPLQLAKCLVDNWEALTGFSADKSKIQAFQKTATKNSFLDLTGKIKNVLQLPDITQSIYINALKNLQKAIMLCLDTEGFENFWWDQLKSTSVFQDLFQHVAIINFSESDIIEVKRIWNKIFDLASNKEFPNHSNAIAWIQDNKDTKLGNCILQENIENVHDFIVQLKGKYHKQWRPQYELVKENKEREIYYESQIFSVIASAVVKLLQSFENKNEVMEYIYLILVLLHLDFDIKEQSFKSTVTFSKLEKIQAIYEENVYVLTKYETESTNVQEAFAFHQLIETVHKLEEASGVDPQHTVNDILKYILNLKFEFDANVKECCVNYTENTLCCLRNIIDASKIISWDYFEKQQQQDISHYREVPNTEESLGETSSIWTFLKMFSLLEYYPNKLSLQDVIAIDDRPFFPPKQNSDIPWTILRNIMSMNNDFRENILENYVRNVRTESLASDDEDFDCFSDSSSNNAKNAKEDFLESLHPTDVFLAIFQCCDPFLKQMLIRNVAMCQLAVPFIYTDYSLDDYVLSLWPLREVFIDLRSNCVATQRLKTVSFIRIGSGLISSKSKIINEFLRSHKEEYNTFFHRDCPLGMNARTISNGSVEASWYVPGQPDYYSENKEMNIKEPLSILNLRGDANELKRQVLTLLHLSNIIVVIINFVDFESKTFSETLEMIHKSNCSVIILTDVSFCCAKNETFIKEYSQTIDRSRTQLLSIIDRKKNRKMNSSELKHALRTQLIRLLTKTESGNILVDVASASGVVTDENKICKDMEERIEKLYKGIEENAKSFDSKKRYLTPLQCEDLWCKWTKKQKEQTKPKNQAFNGASETILKEMQSIRVEQVTTCNKAPKLLALFVQNLLELVDGKDSIQYFICWIRERMDKDSRVIIPTLLDEFITAYERLESDESRSDIHKQEIDRLEFRLAEASFGLEHLLREVGQVYEAFIYCKDDLNYEIAEKTLLTLEQLPIVAAKLLMMGQPLELMDGDAANVPLKWIKAVFSALSKILQNCKLFAISVLGIQSSGKSTLLNTMFGLRFPVRAGRCTRGLFVQMIPVRKSESSATCNYVMVIDTEGLRAPEHSRGNHTHDNELATFVVGIADLVIVNIKGETIADMENVLQISVHGLLRLRQAQKNIPNNQRCILIHQNVPAEDAKQQTLQGNKKTIEHLDIITKEVANQEGLPEISSFRDVIKFDPTKDVYFLPDLWQGSQPMAHVNSSYSIKAIKVREHILDACFENCSLLSIDHRILYIESLWKGIMAEDFVFSFRNCLEVKAYMQLESEFQSLLSSLDFTKLQWMTDNVKPELCRCNKAHELDFQVTKLINDFRVVISLAKNEAEKKITTFMDQSDLNHIMIQWKVNKITSLQFTIDNFLLEVELKINREKQHYLTLLTKSDILSRNEKKIYRKAKELAMSYKGKCTPQDLAIDDFIVMWVTWVNELAPETLDENMEKKDKTLKAELKCILHEKFSEQTPLIAKGLTKRPLDRLDHKSQILEGSFKLNSAKHVEGRLFCAYSLRKRISNIPYVSIPLGPIQSVLNYILESIDLQFDLLFKQDVEYEKSHFRQIIDTIKKGVKEHNKNLSNYLLFSRKLEIKIALHVARHSYHKFREMNRIYEERHGLRSYLLKQKEYAQQLFINIFQAKSQEIIAANIIAGRLKSLIKERIERNLPLQIQRQIVNLFFNRKSVLIKGILEDLADKGDFDSWMRYIKSPEEFTLRWITTKTDSVVFFDKSSKNESFCEKWAKRNLEDLLDDLKEAVKIISEQCTNEAAIRTIDINCWVMLFTAHIESKKFIIHENTFQLACEYNISSFSEFGTHIIRELLGTVEQSLLEEIKQYSPDTINWHDKTPYENIFETIWGCSENCQLCNEPCQKAEKNHASENDCHTCIQHRPLGINGTYHMYTDTLVLETCNFKVQSSSKLKCSTWCGCPDSDKCTTYHAYKKYKTYLPTWDISPSPDESLSVYWNWFVYNNQDKLAKHYEKTIQDIPESWKLITKEKAIKSLSQVYGIEIT